jgi:Rod binding domain-containing protein
MEITRAIAAPATDSASAPERERLEKAGRDFEALLVSELLRAARMNGSSGWLGEEDAAADSAFGLAEQHFAQALAGRLGLARLAVEGLDPKRSNSATPLHKPGRL